MELSVTSTGVGGSYTKWQGEPPSHKVIMAKHEPADDEDEDEDTYTTVKVYNLIERIAYNDDLRIENGAKGPKGISFKHDVDFEDLTDEQQEEIREFAINEFTSTN